MLSNVCVCVCVVTGGGRSSERYGNGARQHAAGGPGKRPQSGARGGYAAGGGGRGGSGGRGGARPRMSEFERYG